jgi:hypothetical protein
MNQRRCQVCTILSFLDIDHMTSARFLQDNPRTGGSIHELTPLGLDLRMVCVRSFNAAHVLYLLYDKGFFTK